MINTLDLTSLKATFDTRRLRLARRLILRNVSQAFTALVTFGCVAWSVLGHPYPVVPGAVSLAIFFAVALFFIVESIRIWSARLPAETPMLEKLDSDIAELRYQRRQLHNVSRWYLAPMAIAIGILIVTKFTTQHQSPQQFFYLAAYIVFCGVAFPFVVKANRCTSRQQIEPRLAELEALRKEMSA